MPNPLPPEISLSVITCQVLLQEADGVSSAIRIVDLWYVPEPPPSAPAELLPFIQAYVVVMLRADPGYQHEHEISIDVQNTAEEIITVAKPFKTNLQSRLGPDVPGGATIAVQLNLAVKRLGTCYVLVRFDGQLAARVPITLLRQPEAKPKE